MSHERSCASSLPGTSLPAVTPRFPQVSGSLHAGQCLSPLCKVHPTAKVTVRAAPLVHPVRSSSAGSRRCSESGYGPAGQLRWHAALLGVSPVNICPFRYPSLQDHLQEVPFWQRFPNTWRQASSWGDASVGAQRVPCTGVLPAPLPAPLPVCMVWLWGPAAGLETLTPRCRARFARGKKLCCDMEGLRLGAGLAPCVPGDVTMPLALQTHAELPRTHGCLCVLLTPEKSRLW